MISALALAVQTSSDLYAHSFDRLTKAIGACSIAPSRPAKSAPTSVLMTCCAR